jgi:hypothetical protein
MGRDCTWVGLRALCHRWPDMLALNVHPLSRKLNATSPVTRTIPHGNEERLISVLWIPPL